MVNGKRSRLGRGLENLIMHGVGIPSPEPSQSEAHGNSDAPAAEVREIALKHIIPNVKQARRTFNEAAVKELAESIEQEGLLQPILVRPSEGQFFMIVAGERRFRAMQSLGKETILARIIRAAERDCAVISLIENLQRESLNPVEEALGFSNLIEEYGFTQEQIAQRVGRARATVANVIRLLNLEPDMLHALEVGQIMPGHAKILLSVEDPIARRKLFEKIIDGNLNIRQTERQAALLKPNLTTVVSSTPNELSTSLMKIEKQIAEQLAAEVSLQHGPKHGKIVIEYSGEQELLRIIQLMGIA